MRDNHFDPINVVRYRIESLERNTQPVHSALYHAGVETREFQKAEMNIMLARQFIEPTQTK